MFKIEDNIPVPENPDRIGKWARKYPFGELEIGQSFYVEANGDIRKNSKLLAAAAHNAGKRYGHKYATRTIENGVRVWRWA